VLVLAVHHIASDGRSSVVLGDDIRELCAALAGGREPDLAPLPVQYADYAQWQRQRLTDSVLEPHLRFWRQELDGAVPLELPTDRPRPAVRDPRGTALTFGVPVRTAEGVAELSRRRGVTPFATYLTAFATLLARWSRQWDVAVGAPVAGRTRPETAALVGPFLNSIVLRCRLAADQSFSYALGQVWRTSRSAFACQDLPFERVVEELRPARDLSRTPLYQVMFNFMDEGVTVTGADDLDALEGAWRVAKTDLTLFLHVAADGGGVTGILEYATALFGRSTIARMAGQFIRLLDAVLTDPAASLRTLGALADVPQGAVERRMAKIWAGLLGRAVGVTENFFQTGGTSRLALVLMAQLQEDFDLDLPVRLIFERPTIAQLSEAVKDLAVAELEQSSGAQVMAGSAQAKEPQA
jgi:non-ribosomal peptide synthetase component F